MKTLDNMLENLKQSFENKQQREAEELKQERYKQEESNLIQLPLWPEAVRGVPNSILRGSLFAAIQGKNARQCKRELLHESDNLKVIYTGTRLNQSDLDVWECALHLARLQNLGNKIDLTEHSFLRSMDRRTGKSDHEWLKDTFAKLTACCIEITHNERTYGGSLVQNFYRDEKSGRCVLIIDPKIARLYEGNHSTWIQWKERQRIGKRKPLAQWLHGYILSHAKWYPHKVATLRDYSGSETKLLKKFKQNLINALEHLESLQLIKSFSIDDKNLVYIERPPSMAQKRHLDTKKAD